MPLDHFSNGSDARSFKNRYWINQTYYQPGGPVFLFDSGEQNAEPLLPYYLQEYHGLSAVMRLAKRYKGLAILWEHRFYGDSLPFPVSNNTTADQWRFLTTDQALEDVVFFANSISVQGLDDSLLKPDATPWVWVGGSYPGVRGALLRQRNPSTIYAAWVSSAPVQAQVDMASYYEAAERSLPRNCSNDWVAVTRLVDDTLMTSTNETAINEMKFALLKARLSGPGGNTTGADGLTLQQAAQTSDVDAASILMDPLDFYQYYGPLSLPPFCENLETRNFTSQPSESGIAAASGDVQVAFNAFLVAISELDYDAISNDPVADQSWMWQYCSEYGFYQRGDPENPRSIETAFLSLSLFQAQCNETFPFPGLLPASPNVQHVNKYGGWNMNPTNVFWTNGEFDPWRTMGLASIEANSPHRTPTSAVPPCKENVFSSSQNFFGLTHTGMVHVSDLRVLLTPDANHSNFKTVGFYSPVAQEPFYSGLGLFELALDEWLEEGCFQRKHS
ncbi:serine carboxypeptidase S28-domain-containing protein [Gautieria morchelliformis]|nr:serine carboxypeptidase S28-domain-containing protein [Gautieria morchelliformis]